MNFFKVIVGVVFNVVITYVSKLYLGLILDKEIVKQFGLMNYMVSGDLIFVDKGFLIQDIVLKGVFVNIFFFLQNGKFIVSEIRVIKNIVRCRIYVERVNVRLKDFKILNFVFFYLRCYVDKVF